MRFCLTTLKTLDYRRMAEDWKRRFESLPLRQSQRSCLSPSRRRFPVCSALATLCLDSPATGCGVGGCALARCVGAPAERRGSALAALGSFLRLSAA